MMMAMGKCGREDNLFSPVERDFGTRGPFTARSRARAVSLPSGGVRIALAVAALAAAAALTTMGAAVGRGAPLRTPGRRPLKRRLAAP